MMIESTLRLLVPTRLGCHATIRTLILRARNAGIDVEYEHDGRFFVRQHLMILTGSREEIQVFVRAWSRYWRASREGLTAQGLRRQRREERQRIGDVIAAFERSGEKR